MMTTLDVEAALLSHPRWAPVPGVEFRLDNPSLTGWLLSRLAKCSVAIDELQVYGDGVTVLAFVRDGAGRCVDVEVEAATVNEALALALLRAWGQQDMVVNHG